MGAWPELRGCGPCVPSGWGLMGRTASPWEFIGPSRGRRPREILCLRLVDPTCYPRPYRIANQSERDRAANNSCQLKKSKTAGRRRSAQSRATGYASSRSRILWQTTPEATNGRVVTPSQELLDRSVISGSRISVADGDRKKLEELFLR